MASEVSRETPPPPPGSAADFGDGWPGAQRYAAFLADAGVLRGVIGPREVPRLWERHLLNCVAVAPALPYQANICDLGSGAGLPGLVLALARPDLRVTLLEPLLRRTRFLEEAVGLSGARNAVVVRGRAEDQRRSQFDVVTARAVAALPRLARWGLPLCRSGGLLLALKGSSAEEELAEAEPILRRLHAVEWRVEAYPAVVGGPTMTVRVVAGSAPAEAPEAAGDRAGSEGSEGSEEEAGAPGTETAPRTRSTQGQQRRQRREA